MQGVSNAEFLHRVAELEARAAQHEESSSYALRDCAYLREHVNLLEARVDLSQSLKDCIQQQSQRLETFMEMKIEKALEKAGTIFLQCLQGQQQRLDLPRTELPPSRWEQSAEKVRDGAVLTNPLSSKTMPTIAGGDVVDARMEAPNYFQGDSSESALNSSVSRVDPLSSKAGPTSIPSGNVDLRNGTLGIFEGDSSRSVAGDKFAPDSRGQIMNQHLEQMAHWEMAQLNKGDSEHSWHEVAFKRKMHEKAITHEFFSWVGQGNWMPDQAPDNALMHLVKASWCKTLVTFAILGSTVLNAYWSDQMCRSRLKEPPESDEHWPKWWEWSDIMLTIFFGLEVVFRMIAERGWFWVSPSSWRWNVLDFSLVFISASLIVLHVDGLENVVAFRALRVFRVVRVTRVFRVVRAFTELRKLMFAVTACIVPLFWAILFIAVTMFLFSLLILQGMASELPTIYENDRLMGIAREHMNGLGACCKTLFCVIFGTDWLEPHEVLSELGVTYAAVMPIFVLFVNLGIMNIVIGVFAEAAAGYTDRDLIAQSEIGHVEAFIGQMLDLWKEFAPGGEKQVDWEGFKRHFYKEDVQAFLSSHGIDSSHVHLIYALCNRNHDDQMDLREFVLGLLRLRGKAKHLDSKIMIHALSALSHEMDLIRSDMSRCMHRLEARPATATAM